MSTRSCIMLKVRKEDIGKVMKFDNTKVKVLLGDANQDGKVSLRDASLALKVTVKKATLTDKGTLAADVDGNGNVTAADSLAIQRFDIGIASGDIGKTVEK